MKEKGKKRERKKKIKNEIMKFKTMNLHEDITQNNMLQNKNVNTDKTEKMLVKILYTVNREDLLFKNIPLFNSFYHESKFLL